MADDFKPSKPAASISWAKEPGGDINFDDRESNLGVWAGVTKKGDNFLKVKCLCGRKGLCFINTREWWRLVKGDSEPKEEW